MWLGAGVTVGTGMSLGVFILSTTLLVTSFATSTHGGSNRLVCGPVRRGNVAMNRAICGVSKGALTGCVGCGCGCSSGGHVARDRTLG